MTTRPDRRPLSRELALRTITGQLSDELADHFTEESVRSFVEEVYEELMSRFVIKTHVVTFTHRFARSRLQALARHEGHIEGHTPVVLFICGRNDGASQMAAALFADQAGDRAIVHSAGHEPAAELLDEAVLVLNEIGISMVAEFPKPLTPEIEADADVIVTLDHHDRVEILEDDEIQWFAWHAAEEHGHDLDGFRDLRDALIPLVADLVATVLGEPGQPAGATDAP